MITCPDSCVDFPMKSNSIKYEKNVSVSFGANILRATRRKLLGHSKPIWLYITLPCSTLYTLYPALGCRVSRRKGYQDAVVDKAYARPSQLRSALKAAVPVSPVLSAGEVGPGVFMQSSMIITLPLASDENLNENDFAPSTTSE